jgi:acetylornithine/succinyldiaminopimelate/putrescine aminotransferase
VEALRVAWTVTGRSGVVMFGGKYDGHADELIAERRDGAVVPEGLGFPVDAMRHVRIVPYNDLDAVEGELRRGDVACVLAEAAITKAGPIVPADGFHAGLRRLTREAGTLLVIDETHTLTAGPGRLTERWGLEPAVLVLGKSIASHVPLDAYGMTETAAAVLTHTPGAEFRDEIATGGTLFGNPVSMAAARVTLTGVLTAAAYGRRGARRAAGRRHRGCCTASPPALARPPAVQPLRLHARAGAPVERRRGARDVRRCPVQPPARLLRQPRDMGGDRHRRSRLQRPRHRGGRRALPRAARRLPR